MEGAESFPLAARKAEKSSFRNCGLAGTPTIRFRFQSFERLTLDRDVERVFAEGERFSDGWLVIYAKAREDKKPFRRLAIRVAKRVGNAPLRSRLRRLVREVFRRDKENLRPSLDLVVIVQPFAGAKKLKYGDLKKKWDELTSQSRMRLSSL